MWTHIRFWASVSLTVLLYCGALMAQPAAETAPTTQPASTVRDLIWAVDRTTSLDVPSLNWKVIENPNEVKLHELDQLHVSFVSRLGAAYLGIGVEPPTETLRSQLKLPEGAGLVVNYVDNNGPSKERVQQHDILQKLDDQILVNADQLVALVRMHKPDDTVSLTLIRHGEPTSVQVKLGSKQESDVPLSLELVRPEQLSSVTFSVPTTQPAGAGVVLKGLILNDTLSDEFARRPMTFNDGELLACLDASGNLLAIDVKSGKVIFHGPLNTEEQWKTAPRVVREKLAAWKSMISPPAGKTSEEPGHER